MNAVIESRLRNVIVIGDKGFFSTDKVKALERHETHYALAVRRDLGALEFPPVSRYGRYFLHNKSVQWWREHEWEGRRVVQYLDKQIAAEEEATFLRDVQKGRAKRADYQARKNTFGTLAIVTDTGLRPKELYELYKQRREIEQAFDALKNTLEADKTWMQSRESMQGYYFILFIALHLYSQALLHLHRKDLLEQYSVHDILWNLTKAYVVTVDGKDILGEVLKTTRDLVAELEIPITEKLGS
jgi:transposase